MKPEDSSQIHSTWHGYIVDYDFILPVMNYELGYSSELGI